MEIHTRQCCCIPFSQTLSVVIVTLPFNTDDSNSNKLATYEVCWFGPMFNGVGHINSVDLVESAVIV